jgi:hypothetical protein
MICYAKCWPCQTQQCPGGEHRWADADDIEHAVKIGKPESAEGICGCPCARGPVIEYDGPPDLDEPVSLNADPCPLCGEQGACAYDDEARPLIHALSGDDE